MWTQIEHAQKLHKDSDSNSGSNSRPWSCDMATLPTTPSVMFAEVFYQNDCNDPNTVKQKSSVFF